MSFNATKGLRKHLDSKKTQQIFLYNVDTKIIGLVKHDIKNKT